MTVEMNQGDQVWGGGGGVDGAIAIYVIDDLQSNVHAGQHALKASVGHGVVLWQEHDTLGSVRKLKN